MNALLIAGAVAVYGVIGTVAAAILYRYEPMRDTGLYIPFGIMWPLTALCAVVYWIFIPVVYWTFIRWIIWLFDALTND